jgi:hypothetical protein
MADSEAEDPFVDSIDETAQGEGAVSPDNASDDEPDGLPFVSAEDFRAVDVNALLAAHPRADKYEITRILTAAEKEAEAEDGPRARVLHLLVALCSFHLLLEPEGDAFGPRLTLANGSRTAIPSDLRGEQSDVLATIAESLDHPFLRARAAEVPYENGNRRMGRIAIDAYAELVTNRLNNVYASTFEENGPTVMDVVRPIERSFQINTLVAKRGAVVDSLREAHALAYARAIADCAYFEFQTLAVCGMNNRLLEPADVAGAAVDLARAAPPDAYCLAVKGIWLVAADAFERAGDEAASRDASLQAIEQTLRMRGQMGLHAARAQWIKTAIAELRSLGDCQDRIEILRKELREAQEKSLDEFGQVSTRLDLGDLRDSTIEAFGHHDPAEAFRRVMPFLEPNDVGALKEEAIEIARRTPLSSIFSSSYADFEGKEVARGPMLDLGGEPSEDWFKEHIIHNQAPVRHATMFGELEPARRTVLANFAVQERHFVPIATFSPFVPPSHRHIFALGFARLWQGDYVTAGHLLIPQLENAIRHVLSMAGRDSSKIEEDGIQGDRALSMLMTVMQDDLHAIFGEAAVWEIDALFNFRPGPAIRHEFAHGKLGWNAFYRPDTMIACWFIYYLTVLPLLERWDDLVAPHIHAML